MGIVSEKNPAAGGGDSYFFRWEGTERGRPVKGLRFAPMNAPRTRALDSSPSPLLSCFQPSKKCEKEMGAGAQRERQDELRHHPLRLRRNENSQPKKEGPQYTR